MVNIDLNKIHYEILLTLVNRLSMDGLSKKGTYNGSDRGILPYLKTPMMRYLNDRPIIPIGYIQHRNPMNKKLSICKFTPEGRKEIHSTLKNIPEWKLRWLRKTTSLDGRTTVEFDDNRLSKFIAQNGNCAVTGKELEMPEIHCHHKIPRQVSKNDRYDNLVIISKDIHELIHLDNSGKIMEKLFLLSMTKLQLEKVNELRELANKERISVELLGNTAVEAVQLSLF